MEKKGTKRRAPRMVRSRRDPTSVGRSNGLRSVWATAAVFRLAIGTTGSVFAAGRVAQNEGQNSQRAFATSSAEIASTLKLAIQHEEDLVVSAGAFALGNPDASNTEFVQWATAVRAMDRYPELRGFGESVIVPASQLGAFAARAVADPVGPLASNGTFAVIPPGNRPYYCLARAGEVRSAAVGIPAAWTSVPTFPVRRPYWRETRGRVRIRHSKPGPTRGWRSKPRSIAAGQYPRRWKRGGARSKHGSAWRSSRGSCWSGRSRVTRARQ
jgi:hypothetical protein